MGFKEGQGGVSFGSMAIKKEQLFAIIEDPRTAPILVHVAIFLDFIAFFLPFFNETAFNLNVAVYENTRFGGFVMVINGIPFILIIIHTIWMLLALWKPQLIKPIGSKILGIITAIGGKRLFFNS